jgi:hypothetical protein
MTNIYHYGREDFAIRLADLLENHERQGVLRQGGVVITAVGRRVHAVPNQTHVPYELEYLPIPLLHAVYPADGSGACHGI